MSSNEIKINTMLGSEMLVKGSKVMELYSKLMKESFASLEEFFKSNDGTMKSIFSTEEFTLRTAAAQVRKLVEDAYDY